MKAAFACYLLFGVCLVLCGCHRQESEDPAVESVRAKFRCIQEGLRNGNAGVSTVFALDRQICGWIACVSNMSQRAALATELSEIILAVDLEGVPYLSDGESGRRYLREVVSYLYLDYVKALFRAMGRCGCRHEDAMEFYFKAIQKFKDAWLNIPCESNRLPGESLEECIARGDAARKLQGLYEQEMSEIRRFVLPRLSDYLPEELHDEFRKRIEPLFDFPSKEEFYEMMHPGCKYPYPSGSAKSAKEEPDVEVKFLGEKSNSSAMP